jgi:uncharacterized 2Fe-2S/4Fe-4S cluster protein (DUF4445 family)
MPVVTFSETGNSVEIPPGITILQAGRQAGAVIESPCNGAGSCGKCTVQLDPASLGNIVQKGMHQLTPAETARGLVLSCEAEIVGDIRVRTVPREKHATLKIISHGVGCTVEVDPYLSKTFDPDTGLTTLWGGDQPLAREPGDTRQALFGAVIDIGTTTLCASLVDLQTGVEIACASALNPQSHHAQDVLSRIRFAATGEGLLTMHEALIAELGRLLGGLLEEASLPTEHLYEIVYSGNTCMLYLAIRENPAELGKFPYLTRLTGDEHHPAAAFRLPASPHALIYLPPVISAYVGPDITSGILATGLRGRPGTSLLVDIGTNGEMVLACDGRLFATSTAAGPAFEGMNISCGMRASLGAIESVGIDARGALELGTIGDVEAVGICGSGLMDLAAQLVASRVVTANGRFCPAESGHLPEPLRARLTRLDGKPGFQVTEKVSISQKDIRQLQLAKGAVRAGIEFLLRQVGIEADQVDRVLIAGSFGFHLRAESLITIGLLPPQFAGRIEFVGNTSKSGAEAFLLNRATRREMAELVGGIEVVELANYPDFDRCFVECLSFPEYLPEPAEQPCT